MINIDHVCEDEDCPHIGQRTFPGCKCHKTREQMLEAEVVRLRERLAAPAGTEPIRLSFAMKVF